MKKNTLIGFGFLIFSFVYFIFLMLGFFKIVDSYDSWKDIGIILAYTIASVYSFIKWVFFIVHATVDELFKSSKFINKLEKPFDEEN